MKNRITVKLSTLASREEAEAVMTELAQLAIEQRQLAAEHDEEVLAVNHRYEQRIAAVSDALEEKTSLLRAWAESNPDQFPKGRKSIEFVSGTLGFRTGTPRLALLSRAFDWGKVLQLLNARSGWAGFIRTRAEVNKDGLLARYGEAPDKASFADELKRVGLKVTQDESFFVDPGLTEVESRQTAAF